LRYELQKFDDFVSNYLSSENNKQISTSEFQQWKQTFIKEQERIQNAFMALAFSNNDDKIIERQIQLYQNKLILLSNELSKRIGSQANTEGNLVADDDLYSRLLIELLKCLTALLTFIEKHFTKYFCQDSIISASYFETSKSILLNKLIGIKEQSLKKKLDPKLLRIIHYHMKNYIDSPKGSSYRKFIYCKTFIAEIHNIVSSSLSGLKLEKQLIVNLIYLNFNVYAFYSYLGKRIIKHYQSKSTYQEQLICLKRFKKLIQQSQIKPDFEFNQGVESLKNTLSKWIEEEISFFRERRQLAIKFKDKSSLKNLPAKNTDKIYSNLSVAQLTYLMKLMANAKIFTPESLSHLVNFISYNFSTAGQKSLSKKSIRNKMYSIEANTIDNIQEVMEALIEQAQSDKELL